MNATPTKQETTRYSQEDQERNDALKEQYTRQIAYNARNLPRWD